MKQIQVLLATDRHCVWGCAVTMRSMLDNTGPDASLQFHVAMSDLPESDRAALAQVVGDEASLRLVPFAPERVRHLLRSRLITHMSYARLFMGEILPQQASRVIYVDCDLLFERSAAELWNMDLGQATLGAADNRFWEDSSRHQARLGLVEARYFSAGVLLVDLDRWRAIHGGARALRFAEKAGQRLILHDQDALNGAFHNDWTELPMHWNTWTIHPHLHQDSRAVFHFMGAPKPWDADYSGRFADKFYSYLDRTPYRGLRPWNPAGLGKFGRKLRRRIPYIPSVLRVARTSFPTPSS